MASFYGSRALKAQTKGLFKAEAEISFTISFYSPPSRTEKKSIPNPVRIWCKGSIGGQLVPTGENNEPVA